MSHHCLGNAKTAENFIKVILSCSIVCVECDTDF